MSFTLQVGRGDIAVILVAVAFACQSQVSAVADFDGFVKGGAPW